jgi:hypothetical protein
MVCAFSFLLHQVSCGSVRQKKVPCGIYFIFVLHVLLMLIVSLCLHFTPLLRCICLYVISFSNFYVLLRKMFELERNEVIGLFRIFLNKKILDD